MPSCEERLAKNLTAILHAAMDSSTDSSNKLPLDKFCSLIQSYPNLIRSSAEMLLEKIKSENIDQSRKALEVLDACMTKSGPVFQMEVATNRFLNGLIRLVSKKHLADKTPIEIRNKIMDLLLLWTVEHPDKEKIKKAYDSLRREGVHHALSRVSSTQKRKDGELFKKLLQSKNPEDILKLSLVNKRLYCQLLETQNTTNVLNQMITSRIKDVHRKDDVKNVCLMKELYENCKKFNRSVLRILETVEDDEVLKDTNKVRESLTEVMEKYKNSIQRKYVQTKCGPNEPSHAESIDLPCGMVDESQTIHCGSSHSSEEDLKEVVFKPVVDLDTSVFASSANFVPNTSLLEPIIRKDESNRNVIEKDSEECKDILVDQENAPPYIDSITNKLFQEFLGNKRRVAKFNKETPKRSINLLLKENEIKQTTETYMLSESNLFANELSAGVGSVECEEPLQSSSTKQNTYSIEHILHKIKSISDMKQDLKVSGNANEETTETVANSVNLQPVENRVMSAQDLCDLFLSSDDNLSGTNTSRNSSNIGKMKPVAPKTDVPLSKISLDINSIKLSNIPSQIIMNDTEGLRIVLNYALDHPSVNTVVIVITTTNRSLSSIDNYEIEASVRKPCKLRLLPLIEKCLPGVKPFEQPAQNIKQILLLYNPTKQPVDITFIIGYKLGDDPDPTKEPVIAKNIRYFE